MGRRQQTIPILQKPKIDLTWEILSLHNYFILNFSLDLLKIIVYNFKRNHHHQQSNKMK